MATIIALSGGYNTGKTTILKQLINQFPNQNVDYKWDKTDKVVRIKYERDGEEKIIGIATCGDDDKVLDRAFKLMGTCNVYVCACHTKGKTIKFLQIKEKYGNSVLLIGRWSAETLASRDAKIRGDNENAAQELWNIRKEYNELQVNKLYELVISKL